MNERKPFKMIKQKAAGSETDVWMLDEGGEFMGLAITMNANDLVLLDYFAIHEKKRGGGIGSRALKLLQEQYEGKRFFLEIESVYEEAEDLEMRKRRKNFYLRNGLTEIGIMAKLFGVNMELLGFGCKVSFAEYRGLYRQIYGTWAEKNVVELKI
ncbi:MAG: hypothetical protein IJ409_04305 [Lachnospiraceae bacterium]|nr:hypothetical protein [Lachnospiraceae bacterium]